MENQNNPVNEPETIEKMIPAEGQESQSEPMEEPTAETYTAEGQTAESKNQPVEEKKPATFWERHKQRKAIKKEKEKNKPLALKIWSWVWLLMAAIIISVAFRAVVGELIRVDGTSMTNTLQDGDIVFLSKWAYAHGDMERNDIVVCRYPNRINENKPGQINLSAVFALDTYTIFVKRLVALPGDTVQFAGGHLYVNGELVPDPEKQASVPGNYGPRVLGTDEYFVVGDNRYASHDSRAMDVGPISKDMIMGKVTYLVMPWSEHGPVE